MNIQRIKCLFGRHVVSHGMYRGAFRMDYLFVHTGKYAVCKCCGKQVDLPDDTTVPMLEPKF